MTNPKIKCEFTDQELNDLWSGLTKFLDDTDLKENPTTVKDLKKLIIKVRKYLGHKP